MVHRVLENYMEGNFGLLHERIGLGIDFSLDWVWFAFGLGCISKYHTFHHARNVCTLTRRTDTYLYTGFDELGRGG